MHRLVAAEVIEVRVDVVERLLRVLLVPLLVVMVHLDGLPPRMLCSHRRHERVRVLLRLRGALLDGVRNRLGLQRVEPVVDVGRGRRGGPVPRVEALLRAEARHVVLVDSALPRRELLEVEAHLRARRAPAPLVLLRLPRVLLSHANRHLVEVVVDVLLRGCCGRRLLHDREVRGREGVLGPQRRRLVVVPRVHVLGPLVVLELGRAVEVNLRGGRCERHKGLLLGVQPLPLPPCQRLHRQVLLGRPHLRHGADGNRDRGHGHDRQPPSAPATLRAAAFGQRLQLRRYHWTVTTQKR
mmetsp:Transcript_26239/g.62668  ORF Transcript_26239/g.62668 Transcript_26239/m.62668 type:complete len:297 (-) Transcript_26239:16-906(-)